MLRMIATALAGVCAVVALPGAWSQDNPYVYVKMSLAVPWTLYFVFLAAVLIPFLLMVIIAWRRQPDEEGDA